MSEQQEVPPVYAIVELMGHVKHAGRITEEEKFGVKMGRVDVPNDANGFTTIFFGGASIYRITVVSEEVARQVARQFKPEPVSPWDFPKQIAAHAVDGDSRSGTGVLETPRYMDDDRDENDHVCTGEPPF